MYAGELARGKVIMYVRVSWHQLSTARPLQGSAVLLASRLYRIALLNIVSPVSHVSYQNSRSPVRWVIKILCLSQMLRLLRYLEVLCEILDRGSG